MKVKEGPLLCPQGSAEADIWATVRATAQPTAELGIWITEAETIAEHCKQLKEMSKEYWREENFSGG